MAESAQLLRKQASGKDRDDVLARAKKRMRYHDERDHENREAQRRDTEFVYVPGKQWDDATRAARDAWKEMCLEFPQLKQFVNQVVNDQRQNRPGVRVHAASGDASVEVADILQGLVRGIEYDSQAESVYDCGYQHSVVGGRGYWRVSAQYVGDDSFDQKLVLERIADPQSVRIDPDFQAPDGCDANWAFVMESVHRDEFAQRWPDAQAMDFDAAGTDRLWFPDNDHVIVADYYERQATTRELVAVQAPDGSVQIGWRDDIEKRMGAKLDDAQIVRSRKAQSHAVVRYTIAGGAQILEEHDWPGTLIPVICTMGDEIMVDGKRVFQGLITQAKSSQALFNYGMTQQAVSLAMTPRARWIAEYRQLEGFEAIWANANQSNVAVLPYRAVSEDGSALPAPQRQPGAMIDAGWVQWTQTMQGLMKSTVGMYENSLGMRGQEVSGRAIKAREMQGDNATFHYADNLARAIALTGRVLVECIPYYYDAQRIVHIVGEDGTRRAVTINEEVPGAPGPDGAVQAIVHNDIRVGKYSVTVSAGPGYQTKRQEMADLLMQLVSADKSGMLVNAGLDIIVKAQEIPEADVLAERVRALLPPPIQAVIAAKDAQQDPKVAAMQQSLQQAQQAAQGMQQQLQQAGQQIEMLKQDKSAQVAASQAKMVEAQAQAERAREMDASKAQIEARKLELDAKGLEIEFLKAVMPLIQSGQWQALVQGEAQAAAAVEGQAMTPTLDALASAVESMTASQVAPRTMDITTDEQGNVIGGTARAAAVMPQADIASENMQSAVARLAQAVQAMGAAHSAPRTMRLVKDAQGNVIGGTSEVLQ